MPSLAFLTSIDNGSDGTVRNNLGKTAVCRITVKATKSCCQCWLIPQALMTAEQEMTFGRTEDAASMTRDARLPWLTLLTSKDTAEEEMTLRRAAVCCIDAKRSKA